MLFYLENESDLDFSDDEDGNTFDVPDVSKMKKKGKKGGKVSF